MEDSGKVHADVLIDTEVLKQYTETSHARLVPANPEMQAHRSLSISKSYLKWEQKHKTLIKDILYSITMGDFYIQFMFFQVSHRLLSLLLSLCHPLLFNANRSVV